MSKQRKPPAPGACVGQAPSILHVDMDAFFVSVEQREEPSLRGRPVIVGFREGRSVVLSASYEARRFGVRSAMPMALALRRCPGAVIRLPRHMLYREVSAQIMAIFRSITDQVEQLSVDEAFLDLAGTVRRLGSPLHTARAVRAQIAQELGITASVGLAESKFVAKIASTQAKPDGLLVIPAEETEAFLHTLPAQALWGVGAKTLAVLEGLGIYRVEQIAHTPVGLLRRLLGVTGEQLHRLAWGIDPRPVVPVRQEKSIGAEETFAQDTRDDTLLRRELLRLAHRTGERLRASGQLARIVTLKLRYADFSLISRSRTLPAPVDSAQVLYREVVALLVALGQRPQAVRLIGVRAEGLEVAAQSAIQLSLERQDEKWRDAEAAMDEVRRKYRRSAATVRPARLVERDVTKRYPAGQGLQD